MSADSLRKVTTFCGGLATGLFAAYWLDAEAGRRRRQNFGGALSRWSRRLWRALPNLDFPAVSDGFLAEQVRSEIRRLVREPRSVHVRVRGGTVHLSGDVLHDEIETVLQEVLALAGVCGVDNALELRRLPAAPLM